MDARLYDIINNKSKDVDELIRKKYSSSYLNNSKWYRLIDLLTIEFDEVFINFKLVYDDIIEGYLFDSVDFKPYFLEPITYKEVEWIEFPAEYEYWINKDNLKAGKKTYNQDYKAIKSKIESIGDYRIDEFENKLKLYAYS
jgi:hypothetical protein